MRCNHANWKEWNIGDRVVWAFDDFDGSGSINAVITEKHDDHLIAKADGQNLWVDDSTASDFELIRMNLKEFLKFFDFSYKKESGLFKLVDLQGGNFGDIESERFETIESVLDRLDIYYTDYIFSDLPEGYKGEEDYEEILNWLCENAPDSYLIPYVRCIVFPDTLKE